MTILVLAGTTTGRARAVADAVARRLERAGIRAGVAAMDRIEPGALETAEAWIVCTSTFGSGGVPVAAAGFLAAIAAGTVACAGRPVGFVGLGDRSFARTYNAGWRAFEAALLARGARRIGEPLLFDAADVLPPAEETARRDARVNDWVEAFLAALAASPDRA